MAESNGVFSKGGCGSFRFAFASALCYDFLSDHPLFKLVFIGEFFMRFVSFDIIAKHHVVSLSYEMGDLKIEWAVVNAEFKSYLT